MGDMGVDVANHQMGLDWRVLRNAGMTFGWFKLTEGIGYTDPWSDEHEASARAAGMAHGAYHFARPDTNTPQQDAEWFARVLVQRNLHTAGHLPPVLDFEDPLGVTLNNRNCRGASSVGDWARQFLVRATELTGRADFVTYASTSMIADRMGGDGFMPGSGHRLWVAHYGRTAGSPGWLTSRVIAHQYTSDGRVPGWRAGLDFNTLMVPLDALLSGAPAPTPQPPAPPSGGGGGAPMWPLPGGHYFGPIWGPNESHGGHYPAEREHIRRIQLALCAKGHARRASGAPVSDPNGWSDGKYGQPTVDAMKRFQAAVGYHRTGNVWKDDWDALLGTG